MLQKIRRTHVIYTLTALPFLLLCFWVNEFFIDIPFWDEWSILPITGIENLSFAELWQQHSEHRIFFPRLLTLSLAHFSHWDIRWEIMGNVIISGLSFLVIFHQLKKHEREYGRPFPLIGWLAISLLFFSFSQYENWLWGFQIQIFIARLAMLCGFTFLTHWRSTFSYRPYALALLCGVVATFSFGGGLCYWPTGAFLLFTLPKKRKLFLSLWCIVSLAVILLYFHGYTQPPHTSGLMFGVRHPWECLIYLCITLGAPIAPFNIMLALIIGFTGLVIFSKICFSRRKNILNREPLDFFIILIIFTLINALVTAMSRVELGLGQAITSRYITIHSFFWISLIVMTVDMVYRSASERKKWFVSVIAGMVFVVLGYIYGVCFGQMFSDKLMTAKTYILTNYPDISDDAILKTVYPNPNQMRPWIAAMAEKKLSLFRE